MKAKTRLLWMQLHAYFSCFFLPITLVYLMTGMLYFFDIKGQVATEVEYFVDSPQGWISDQHEAKAFVLKHLKDKGHPELPKDYYWEELHDWYGHEQEVLLKPTDDPNVLEIHVKEHDWLKQLLIIHKGFAGWFFKLLSVLFGLSLLFSVISGVIITLQLPKLKVPSLICIGLGAGVFALGFVV